MMIRPILTGAEKARLRGLGQRLDPSLKMGKEGVTPPFLVELRRQLKARELVKLRFSGVDRAGRAALCDRIAAEGPCECAGAVGHTALFYLAK
ncbi:MAG TPA: YhbY family RNA-binding protein [Opitutaceae bacterium]|jgi:RNA-binding protein